MEGADLAIVEGAMGLFDGVDSPETGTSAEIARVFRIPVILVVNATRMTSSIAAMVTGYQNFRKDVKIAGVILNQVSGKRHEQKLRAAVETYCHIPVVGSIPRDLDLRIHERHLGLIPSRELKESESMVERIGRKLENCLDLDAILSIAQRHTPHPHPLPQGGREGMKGKRGAAKVRIGVMYDQVFHFYYPENLEALESEGAELIFINSLEDRLPEIDGLYIGGGFPELFLEALERNHTLRGEIREAVEAGLPVYAECAGLMYLCQSMEAEDRSYEMAGILPARVKMSKRPQGHGYVVAEVIKENPFFSRGLVIRGHEFHHSSLSFPGHLEFAYRIERGHGIQGASDGIVYKNLFASYVHLHALGTLEWAPAFVSLALKAKRVRVKVAVTKPVSFRALSNHEI
jgi:cobyrinic acid a,c-diamide synthase